MPKHCLKCRKPTTGWTSYCAFHWAEYQREWRKAHPTTPEQAQRGRERSAKSRAARKGHDLRHTHDCMSCHFYDDHEVPTCLKHRQYMWLHQFPFQATSCRDYSKRFVVQTVEKEIPVEVAKEPWSVRFWRKVTNR